MHLGQCSLLVENSLWQSEPDGRERIDVTKLMHKSLKILVATPKHVRGQDGGRRHEEAKRISEN